MKKDINPHGAKSSDIKDATKYERERNGKRQFKGKSPLATSKGGTLVARESIIDQLRLRYGKNITNKSILNEKSVLFDDNSEINEEK